MNETRFLTAQCYVKTAVELIDHFLCLPLLLTSFMLSIWLWSSIIRNFNSVTETVQISSISIPDIRTWLGHLWRRSSESWIIWTSPLTRPVWRVWSDISEDLIIGLADSRSTLTTRTTGPSCRHSWRKQIKPTLIDSTNIYLPTHLIFQNQLAPSNRVLKMKYR